MTGDRHDRAYLRSRIQEETSRHQRHSHPFALLVFEAGLTGDGVTVRRKCDWLEDLLRARLRPSDVIARAFEDTVVALLVETGRDGAHDALFRVRGMIAASGAGAGWHIDSYVFPDDAGAIAALTLMTAA